MFRFNSLLSLLILVSGVTSSAVESSGSGSSGSRGQDFIQRAERRESKRWTLQEWLAQKDRNKMMDMWLSMNAPSPYELMLGCSYNSFQSETSGVSVTPNYTSYLGTISAYAQFVGLTAEYENNTQEGLSNLSGLFNLRLIGHTIQGSYLAIHYGQRTRNVNAGNIRMSQQFAQATLQVYMITNFGFDGSYRYYVPTSENGTGDELGNTAEAGAFIDFKNFRIFGSWWKEVQINKNAGTETNTTRSGIRSGVKIFF